MKTKCSCIAIEAQIFDDLLSCEHLSFGLLLMYKLMQSQNSTFKIRRFFFYIKSPPCKTFSLTREWQKYRSPHHYQSSVLLSMWLKILLHYLTRDFLALFVVSQFLSRASVCRKEFIHFCCLLSILICMQLAFLGMLFLLQSKQLHYFETFHISPDVQVFGLSLWFILTLLNCFTFLDMQDVKPDTTSLVRIHHSEIQWKDQLTCSVSCIHLNVFPFWKRSEAFDSFSLH